MTERNSRYCPPTHRSVPWCQIATDRVLPVWRACLRRPNPQAFQLAPSRRNDLEGAVLDRPVPDKHPEVARYGKAPVICVVHSVTVVAEVFFQNDFWRCQRVPGLLRKGLEHGRQWRRAAARAVARSCPGRSWLPTLRARDGHTRSSLKPFPRWCLREQMAPLSRASGKARWPCLSGRSGPTVLAAAEAGERTAP